MVGSELDLKNINLLSLQKTQTESIRPTTMIAVWKHHIKTTIM